MDKFDLEILKVNSGKYIVFDLFQTYEDRVNRWIENERCRSVFSKQEIINLFDTKHKIQMVQVKSIVLHKYDKIIIWTPKGKYFVMEVINIHG